MKRRTQRRGKYHTKNPGFAGKMLHEMRFAFGRRWVASREVLDAFNAGAYAPEDSWQRRFHDAVKEWSPEAKPEDARSLCLRRGISEDGLWLGYRNGLWRVFAVDADGNVIDRMEDDEPPPSPKAMRELGPPTPTMTPVWNTNPVPAPPAQPQPEAEPEDDDDFDWDAIDAAMAANPVKAQTTPAWQTTVTPKPESEDEAPQ